MTELAVTEVNRTEHEKAMGCEQVYEVDGVRVGATRRGTLYCVACGFTGCAHLAAVRAHRRAS